MKTKVINGLICYCAKVKERKDTKYIANIFKCVIFKDQFRCRCVLVYKTCQCVYLFADVRTLISTHQALMCFPIYKIRNNSNDNNLYTFIFPSFYTAQIGFTYICTKHVSHKKVFFFFHFWLVFENLIHKKNRKKNNSFINI